MPKLLEATVQPVSGEILSRYLRKAQSFAQRYFYISAGWRVTLFFVAYILVTYSQGLFTFDLFNYQENNDRLRNPNLPFWLKMSDEIFLSLGLGYLVIFKNNMKTVLKHSLSLLFVVVPTAYLITMLIVQSKGGADIVGLSVVKNLACGFFIIHLLSCGVLDGILNRRFIYVIHVMLVFILACGLLLYFNYPYQVYANRLIGLSLNPNFNAFHALFLLLLFYSGSLSARNEIVSGFVATAVIFFSFSMTVYLMLTIQIFWFGVMLLLFYRSYLKTFLKKTGLLVSNFVLMFGMAMVFKPVIVTTDYYHKFNAITGLFSVENNAQMMRKISETRDYESISERIGAAKMVYRNLGMTFSESKYAYKQADSSLLNILNNFGVIGFFVVFLALGFWYFKMARVVRPADLGLVFRDPLFMMSLIFTLNFLLVGCLFQQYLENWNTLFLFIVGLGFLRSRLLAFQVPDHYKKPPVLTIVA